MDPAFPTLTPAEARILDALLTPDGGPAALGAASLLARAGAC